MTTDYRDALQELHTSIQLYTGQNPAAADVHPAELTRRLMDAMAASAASLAQPEPVPPTDEELLAMRSWSCHGPTFDSDLVDFGRRCYNLARWGTPTIQPVPVSERLPGPEELATLVPLMHSGASLCHSEGFYEESDAIGRIADFLEQLMPQAGEATND
jgi:hypothetical protein